MSEHDHSHHAPDAPLADSGTRALDEALRSSFGIVKVAMVIMLVVVGFSGVKTVGVNERAVILRFGKPLGTGAGQLLGPGLHWAFPQPIDEIVTIPVTEIQKATSTVGWFSITPAQEAAGQRPMPTPSLNPAVEGYVVMADNNIMHARVSLGYRITDPIAYTFSFLNASNTVISTLNNSLVFAAARTTADEALTNKPAFKEKIFAHLRDQIELHRLGITIEPSSSLDVVPPASLQGDFDAVAAAAQDSSTAVNKARGDADAAVLKAQTDANVILNTAESERNRIVEDVRSFAKSFEAQLPQYHDNPELFRQLVLAETWKRVLSRADDKFFQLEPLTAGQGETRLLLGREPQKPRTSTPNP